MTESVSLSARLKARVARTVALARAYGFFEQVWPRIVVAGCVVGAFLIISWFGVWLYLPDLVRFALVGLFGLALAAAILWVLRSPLPPVAEARKRVEEASDLSDRPLTALQDAPLQSTGPTGQALWQAHQSMMADRLKRLRPGTSAPRTDRLDPFALRALIVLGLVVAFFVAGPDRDARVLQAFAPPTPVPTVPVRLDVWANPPAYTGLAPRTLITGADLNGTATLDLVTLPEGSRLTVLVSEAVGINAVFRPADGSDPLPLSAGDSGVAIALEGVLESDALLDLSGPGGRLSVPLAAIADAPPTIMLDELPSGTPAGLLHLRYAAEDDYGVVAAQAEVEPLAPRFDDATPLFDAPQIALVLPRANGDVVETRRDLSAHPWAGLSVRMTLIAEDGAGQTAATEPVETILPQRSFREPLARALVEQRRLLAVDIGQRQAVLTALEGLALGPEDFMADDFATFLALTVTTQRLRHADDEAALIDVTDLLWQLALQVEDGDLSLAAERLREAEERLSEALEQGADAEEISRLMDELRQAFEEYMQALAERMQQSDLAQLPQDQPLQNLNPMALQDLMDQIENLTELGAADAARALLDQLRDQLDQLRGAQIAEPREPSPAEQALREAIGELQEITREQQRLLDDTFPLSRDAQRPQLNTFRSLPGVDNNMPPPRDRQDEAPSQEELAQQLEELAEQQQALEEQLQGLMDQLRDLGLDPSQLGEAGEAMEGAGEMLDRGSASNALPRQGEALEALRQGAQDVFEQLAQQGEGDGQGEGQGQGQGLGQGPPRLLMAPGMDGGRGTDPLGRPQRQRGFNDDAVRIPEESDVQRARDILNEIQRRLGERNRPQPERDYLDRLIERF
ncbi:MAG: TIGR02302 family protein [Cohaesibacteraceae bacterium]